MTAQPTSYASAGPFTADGPVLDQLYTQHIAWLRHWLRRRLGGDSHQACDLAQDAFMRLLSRPRTINSEPRAYLSAIAHGLLVDHWRRQCVERAWLDTLAAQPQALAPSAEQQAMVLQCLCRIDALLERLPAKVRQSFILSQLEGLSYREIGAQLGVSERMVKKYMAQAMLHCLMLQDA